MENKQLYELLEIPNDVIALFNRYAATREQDIPSEIYDKLLKRTEWEDGVKELQSFLGDEREIAVHIPADADMSRLSVQKSLSDFYDFRNKYYEDWKDVKLTCDTWMLMPELQDFLEENSNIVAFQKLFDIEYIDREATWYMGWIFPGYSEIDDKLPEKTLLQRRLKKHLLEGNKFGIAKGHIR